MGIILAVLLFSTIVIIHELGHFLLAKANGIQVDEFSLGLGPTLFGKEIKGTKFSVKLLPFGGACMMGEDDTDNVSEGSFNSKSVWARISVIAAGPVFNLVLAWILCIIMVGWIGYRSPEINAVNDGYAAAEEGLRAGDKITKIDGKRIHLWDEISMTNLTVKDGDVLKISYEREGKEHTALVEARMLEGDSYAKIGIESKNRVMPAGIFETLQYGAYTVKYWVRYTFECLKMLVTGQVGIKDMSGPVGIVNVVDSAYQQSRPGGISLIVLNLLNIGILLTANLGVMNLIPFPALDGGRLLFLFVEAIRGKRISPEKEGMVHFVGFALLMVLMIVILYNDVMKIL